MRTDSPNVLAGAVFGAWFKRVERLGGGGGGGGGGGEPGSY